MRYFEDFVPGETVELGFHQVTAESIIAFAEQFDPQPFHTDPEAARDSFFGELVASGWHTAAIFMRLFWAGLLRDCASAGSPGADQLRWLRPVRPGDTLHARLIVGECRPSASRPEIGIVRASSEMANQEGVAVYSIQSIFFVFRRPAA